MVAGRTSGDSRALGDPRALSHQPPPTPYATPPAPHLPSPTPLPGLAVAESVPTVGALLVFALLVAPAAIAQRLVRRPYVALFLGALLALLFTWIGLFIAFYLPYPVSFVISALAFIVYLGVIAGARLASRNSQSSAVPGGPCSARPA